MLSTDLGEMDFKHMALYECANAPGAKDAKQTKQLSYGGRALVLVLIRDSAFQDGSCMQLRTREYLHKICKRISKGMSTHWD